MRKSTLAVVTVLALSLALPVFAADDGAAIFKSKCAMCHGADGSGSTPMGKSMKMRDLRSPEVQKQTDIQLTDLIAGGKGKMPAYGKKLTTSEIQAVISHLRTLKK
jgi:cytochrome c6